MPNIRQTVAHCRRRLTGTTRACRGQGEARQLALATGTPIDWRMSPHIRGVPVRRDEPRETLMRLLLRPLGHLFRRPVRISVFVVHLTHHLAAFFAWIWMLVHVVGAVAQAGLQAGRLSETRVLTDVGEQGTRYFSVA